MSESYSRRLKWQPAADRGAGFVASPRGFGMEARDAAAAQSRTARMLGEVGLPIGSTDAARSSPLLEARDLLRAAAEIEHGLLVQYLYAAYSCTRLGTRGPIAQIAKEEMGHLISVQNLILAIGGRPYFGRDEFPTAPTTDDVFPFPLTFEPLSLDSIAKYVVAESPDLESIDDAVLKARLEPILATAKGKAHPPINHVGALYVALYWLFKEDDSAPAGWPDYPTELVSEVHATLGRRDWHIRAADFAKQQDFEDLQADPGKSGEEWNKGDERILRSGRWIPGYRRRRSHGHAPDAVRHRRTG